MVKVKELIMFVLGFRISCVEQSLKKLLSYEKILMSFSCETVAKLT